MGPTLYAAFADAGQAESAAGALLDHGIKAEEISLVVSEETQAQRGTVDDPELSYSSRTIVSGRDLGAQRLDPFENDLRISTPTGIQGGDISQADMYVTNTRQADHTLDELNPAQDDYPRTGSASPTEFSSVPADARRDYNPDLDKREYDANYASDVDNEIRSDFEKDRARANDSAAGPQTDRGMEINPSMNAPDAHPGTGDRSTMGGGQNAEQSIPPYDPDRAAKGGITTTTLGDAASGAAKGAGLGLGVGALAAVAAVTIPGFGLILGGGALAAALAGLAATAGAGAVAGGVVGYLKDQGVDAHAIPQFQEAYEAGGAILSVHVGDPKVSREAIENVLRKYGAQRVEAHGFEEG